VVTPRSAAHPTGRPRPAADHPATDHPTAQHPTPQRPTPEPRHLGNGTAHTDAAAHPGGEAAQRPDFEAAGELLRALAAPLRIAIVTELGDGERCVHELVDALAVSQPLVSQHLRVLRAAGVVRGQRRGREIAYALADAHVAHIVADAVSHAREL
jgi:ArsR family transcriptional regulator, zinc-responsive transcriptional repressor